jgi:DNA-binding transcriptional ArsR family regulator
MRKETQTHPSASIIGRPKFSSGRNKKFFLLANTFKTLGDYSRVRIVGALVQGEKCPGEIAKAVSLSPSAVSHHLKVLREAKLVQVRREHRQIFYSLDDLHINELFEAGVEHVEELLQ